MIYFVSSYGRTKKATRVKPEDNIAVYHNADSLYVSIGGTPITEHPLRSTITRARSVKETVEKVFNAILGIVQNKVVSEDVVIVDVDSLISGIMDSILPTDR